MHFEIDDRTAPNVAANWYGIALANALLGEYDAAGKALASARSEFDARAVFEACLEHDVAVEINSRPERRDPPTPLLELARDVGCRFAIDSDSHAPGQLDFLDYGCERAEAAGIEPDRIVNTWPGDRLLAWARKAG